MSALNIRTGNLLGDWVMVGVRGDIATHSLSTADLCSSTINDIFVALLMGYFNLYRERLFTSWLVVFKQPDRENSAEISLGGEGIRIKDSPEGHNNNQYKTRRLRDTI
jgi:hypothetical protein